MIYYPFLKHNLHDLHDIASCMKTVSTPAPHSRRFPQSNHHNKALYLPKIYANMKQEKHSAVKIPVSCIPIFCPETSQRPKSEKRKPASSLNTVCSCHMLWLEITQKCIPTYKRLVCLIPFLNSLSMFQCSR